MILPVLGLLAFLVPFGVSAPGDSGTQRASEPATYEVDLAHSEILFKVRHLGISTVTGTFGKFTASIVMDPSDIKTLKAQAAIDVATIDTRNERRDEHLRSADFFEAETHPEMVFQSREVRNVVGSKFELVGDLTLRGITKPVVLQAEMSGPSSLMGKERIAFTASGVINRTDFGLVWNRVVEAGSLVAGEEVRFEIEVAAVRADV
jgi:polyisoprenoid-binding protein YceI